MATELVTGLSKLGLIASNAQRSEQVCAGIAGEVFQAPRVNRRRMSSDLALVEERGLPAGALRINRERARPREPAVFSEKTEAFQQIRSHRINNRRTGTETHNAGSRIQGCAALH